MDRRIPPVFRPSAAFSGIGLMGTEERQNRDVLQQIKEIETMLAVSFEQAVGLPTIKPMSPEGFVTLMHKHDLTPVLVDLITDLAPEPQVLIETETTLDAAGLALLGAGLAPTIQLKESSR